MLRSSLENIKSINRFLFALLFTYSVFTFQTNAFAQITNKVAQEYKQKGLLEQQKGNFSEAFTHYKKAIALGSWDKDTFKGIAQVYAQWQDFKQAEYYYLQALDVDPNDPETHFHLGALYTKTNRLSEAIQSFKTCYTLAKEESPLAASAAEQLKAISPDYEQLFRSKEIQEFETSLAGQIKQDRFQRIEEAKKFYLKGQKYYKKGKYEKAIQEYNTALQFMPQHPEIINAKNMALIKIVAKNIKEKN